jgi:hypothetical protein
MGDPEESIRNSLASQLWFFGPLVDRYDPGGIHSLSLLNLRSPQALFPESGFCRRQSDAVIPSG